MSSNVIRKVAYARENGFYKIEQARPHKAPGSGWVLSPPALRAGQTYAWARAGGGPAEAQEAPYSPGQA